MSFNTTILRRSLLAFGLLLGAGSLGAAWAQPSTGGPAPVPAAVPLDGGTSLLLAAGVGWGIRQLRQRRRPA